MCLAPVLGKMGFTEFLPTDGDMAVEIVYEDGETLGTLFMDSEMFRDHVPSLGKT